MTLFTLDQPAPPVGRTWRERLCARMGGLCRLVRAAHSADVPF